MRPDGDRSKHPSGCLGKLNDPEEDVMTMQQQKLFQMFETYYDVDLDNCLMTHEDWIRNIVEALTDDNYLDKMMVFFKEYEAERNA
jgi:hypothetical protein